MPHTAMTPHDLGALRRKFPLLLRHGPAVELMAALGYSNCRETLARLAAAGTVGTRYPQGAGTRAFYVRDDIIAHAPQPPTPAPEP